MEPTGKSGAFETALAQARSRLHTVMYDSCSTHIHASEDPRTHGRAGAVDCENVQSVEERIVIKASTLA